MIFDEPTAALDPVNVIALEAVLEKLYRQGKTILVSTHDLDFAYRWAERIIVFGDGQIIADGVPEEVFRNEEVLKQANLKKPTMLEVAEILAEKNLGLDKNQYPKNVSELRNMPNYVLLAEKRILWISNRVIKFGDKVHDF